MAFLAMHDEPDLDALLTNWLGASRQVLAPLVQWGEGTMAPAELRAPLPEPDPNPKGKPREPNGDLMAQSPPDVVLIPGDQDHIGWTLGHEVSVRFSWFALRVGIGLGQRGPQFGGSHGALSPLNQRCQNLARGP